MTPNIQIGTVTQGASFNVTRTGTNENPILNFTLVKGDKGDRGIQGIQGLTGNGISSITKTGTSGLVDTYTITYTNGNTTTFTVTNGEDGEVTETELNELRQQVEDLEDNQRTNRASGTEIHISDSAKAKVRSIGLTGRSTQEERRGYNIFPSAVAQTVQNKGLTIECDGKGRYNVSGTPTDDVAFDFELPEQVTLPISAGQGGKGKMYFFNDFTGGTINFLTPDKGTIDSWGLSSLNRTHSAYSAMGGKVCKYIRIYGFPNVAMNGTLSPMFTNEGDTNREFQEYNGQAVIPISPDNVTPIKSCGDNGSVNEKVQNKNYADYTKVKGTYQTTVSLIENGFKVVGSYAGSLIVSGLKKNTTYYLSYIRENITSTVTQVTVFNADTSTVIKQLASSGTFNTGNNTTVNIWFYAGQGTSQEAKFTNIQVSEGSTATDYVPHEEQNISFPLAQGQKLMQGDYPDDDEKVHHKRGETILGEISSLATTTIFGVECKYQGFILPNAKSVGRSYNFVCDRVSPANEVFGQYKGYRNGNTLVILTTLDDTVENFNSKISGAIVQYELATEQTEDFTEEQKTAWEQIKKARTYKGGTHISSEDETSANVDIEYVVDVNTIYDRITALENKVNS